MAKEFAVINLNKNNQFIVQKNDIFTIDRLSDNPDLQVLMYVNGDDVLIGKPFLEEFGVKLEVLEDKLDKKISVRRFRNKSRYRRNNGHRQPISVIKILDFGSNVKTEISKIIVLDEKPVSKTEIKEVKPDAIVKAVKEKKAESAKVSSKQEA